MVKISLPMMLNQYACRVAQTSWVSDDRTGSPEQAQNGMPTSSGRFTCSGTSAHSPIWQMACPQDTSMQGLLIDWERGTALRRVPLLSPAAAVTPAQHGPPDTGGGDSLVSLFDGEASSGPDLEPACASPDCAAAEDPQRIRGSLGSAMRLCSGRAAPLKRMLKLCRQRRSGCCCAAGRRGSPVRLPQGRAVQQARLQTCFEHAGARPVFEG